MAMYRLKILSGANRWKDDDKGRFFGTPCSSIEIARQKAVSLLIANNVKGQIVDIYKSGKWIGTVSMQIDSNVYVKPSVGLAKGMKFLYDDGNVFYTCYENGKIKKW